MMKVAVYHREQLDDFARAMVIGESFRVPKDHFVAGVVVGDDNRPLAKASLYINTAIFYNEKPVGLIGAYASDQNAEAVTLLFGQLEKLATQYGIDYLIGPMDGSTWENYRFHDLPDIPAFFSEMKHPIYYPQQWMEHGFRPIAKYYSAESYDLLVADPSIEKTRKHLAKEGVSVRSIHLTDYGTEMHRLYPFLQQAFSQNFLYSPISFDAFVKKYRPLKDFLKPEYVLVAEHRDKIVGVFLCVEDFLCPNPRTLIIKTIARNPDALYRGLGHVMAQQVYKSAYENGFKRIIHAFLKEEGTSTSISQHFSGHPFKYYSLYGKAI